MTQTAAYYSPRTPLCNKSSYVLWFTAAGYSLTSGTVQYVTFTTLMMLLPVLLHTGVFLHVYYSDF
jgi:hypothetical protein